MKQRLILFSALLITSLLLGVASAQENDLGINITHNGTDNLFKPGDVVNITADFNRSVDQATISINNSRSTFENNVSMTLIGENEIGGNSFGYDYEIPYGIVIEPLDLNISAFNSSIEGSKIVDNAFVFNVNDYLDIGVKLNRTGNLRPGDIVNITADFTKPVDHANISISNGLPRASNVNVGASLLDNEPMDKIDDDTFGYDYEIPEDISGPLDMDVSGFDENDNLLGDDSFPDEFGVDDSFITIISPTSEFVGKECVDFNFTAYDASYQSGSQLSYTFYLNGISKSSGTITAGQYKQLEFNLDDGNYTWEIKTRDSDGQTHTTGSRTLYVDTKCPSVKLNSPQDCYKEIIGPTQFNFTCEDALAAQYSDLDLSYQLYIDGELADNFSNNGDEFSGSAKSGQSIVKELELADGAHNWSVYVEDGAGNNATSEVRKFYVDLNGLTVSLASPDGNQYVPANPMFNFTVTGNTGDMGNNWDESEIPAGEGLPFNYKLLVDGKEVKASCCDCDCDGENDCDEGNNGGDNGCVSCSEGNCDGNCFVVGKTNYSIKASVADGVHKNWTVIITDSTTGKTYQPSVKYFSVDSVAPACVANLNVEDALGLTDWRYVVDYPGLMVSWNASTDKDLASKDPYEVYISTSKPSCIEDMQKVVIDGTATHTDGSDTPNQALEYSEDAKLWNVCIEAINGKDLVYGKDYWVAVIARDNASNYNSDFSKCGPVQTYEDMNMTLEEGWNLKSVPKALVASKACPEDVFGDGSTVLYWDGSCWQFPETIEPCKGYWVYAKEPLMTSVKFKGMPNGANPDVPASLELTQGWHMIGHTKTSPVEWPTTLASLSDSILGTTISPNFKFSNLITYSQDEGWGGIISDQYLNTNAGGSYINSDDPMPVGALQSENFMVPGQGYWIFMKDKGTYASIENVNTTVV